MFYNVYTAFSYGRDIIVCLIFQESFKVKESSLYDNWKNSTFLFGGAELWFMSYFLPIYQGSCSIGPVVHFMKHEYIYENDTMHFKSLRKVTLFSLYCQSWV